MPLLKRQAAAWQRDRSAEHGREYVGLTIQIPWTAWGSGYETSAEYSTATVIEYKPETREGNSKKIVSRFHVAFDPELDYDDTHLSWDELLGKSPCRLGSRYAILDTQPGKPLGRRQPPGKPPRDLVYGGHLHVRHVPSTLPYTSRQPTFHNATHHSTLRSGCWVVGLQYKPHRPTTAHRRVNERPKSHHRKPALTKTYAHSNLVLTHSRRPPKERVLKSWLARLLRVLARQSP